MWTITFTCTTIISGSSQVCRSFCSIEDEFPVYKKAHWNKPFRQPTAMTKWEKKCKLLYRNIWQCRFVSRDKINSAIFKKCFACWSISCRFVVFGSTRWNFIRYIFSNLYIFRVLKHYLEGIVHFLLMHTFCIYIILYVCICLPFISSFIFYQIRGQTQSDFSLLSAHLHLIWPHD